MLNLKSEANNNQVIVNSYNKYPSKPVAWSVESNDARSVQVIGRPSNAATSAGTYLPLSGVGNGYPKPPPMYSNKNNGSSQRNDTLEMQAFNDVAKNMESGFGAEPQRQYAYGSSNQWHR